MRAGGRVGRRRAPVQRRGDSRVWRRAAGRSGYCRRTRAESGDCRLRRSSARLARGRARAPRLGEPDSAKALRFRCVRPTSRRAPSARRTPPTRPHRPQTARSRPQTVRSDERVGREEREKRTRLNTCSIVQETEYTNNTRDRAKQRDNKHNVEQEQRLPYLAQVHHAAPSQCRVVRLCTIVRR